MGDISWYANDDGGTKTRSAMIRAIQTDVSASSDDSKLSIYTQKSGTETETMTIVSGAVGIGQDTPSFPLVVKAPTSSETAIALFENAGTSSQSGLYVNLSGATPNDRTDYYLFATGGGGDVSLFTDGGASFAGKVDITSAQSGTEGNLKLASDNSTSSGISFFNTGASAASSRKWSINTNYSAEGTFEIRRNDNQTGSINTVVLKLDSSSRISLSNNDSGGTGGQSSTSGNTIL